MAMTTAVPVVSDVLVYAGDNLRLEYHLLDGDSQPVDRSGWVFSCQWRSRSSSATSIVLTVDQTAADVGTIVITATAAQTEAMRSGVFDLQGVSGANTVTYLRGSIVWTKDVTHA